MLTVINPYLAFRFSQSLSLNLFLCKKYDFIIIKASSNAFEHPLGKDILRFSVRKVVRVDDVAFVELAKLCILE